MSKGAFAFCVLIAIFITIAAANSSEIYCRSTGGTWVTLAYGTSSQCSEKLSDAGKSCIDSKNCEGACYAPKGSVLGERSKGLGSCQAHKLQNSCDMTLEQGVASPGSCFAF